MPEKSSDSVRITFLDIQAIREALREYVKDIAKKHPELVKAVLFGSFAKGNAVPGSDVDIMLVLSRASKSFQDRMVEFLPSRFPVGIDVFPYTEEEVREMLEEGNHFVASALAEGKVIFFRGDA